MDLIPSRKVKAPNPDYNPLFNWCCDTVCRDHNASEFIAGIGDWRRIDGVLVNPVLGVYEYIAGNLIIWNYNER